MRDRVTPSTREGIEDILKELGMLRYDVEEFFFKTDGRSYDDSFSFIEKTDIK